MCGKDIISGIAIVIRSRSYLPKRQPVKEKAALKNYQIMWYDMTALGDNRNIKLY